ncbi:MAG: M28 family peptidase [Caulobacterales bacterium]
MALLLLALMSAGVLIQPPPVRKDNSAAQFDAVAAQARLVRILGDQAPHPVDSAAEDAVRDRLLAEIRALGFAPSVQDSFTCRSSANAPAISCARVRNIEFQSGSAAKMLAVSHYDSVPAGPGASDSGIGVAAWLEIARIAKQERLNARFLLTDGEEAGLLGADAFARDPTRMKGVTHLINIDARGTKGPALFFETNGPNADAVRAYAKDAQRPMTNSIMADVYRLLPNSTDVSVLKRPGLDVINIALLDGFENYHTPRDSLSNVDMRSLQHMGDSALGAVRGFATAPKNSGDVSLAYTDIASRGFIAAPEWAARFGLIAGIVILGFFLLERGAEKQWKAVAAPLVAVVVGLAIAFAGGAIVPALRADTYWFAHPEISRFWIIAVALAGLCLSLMRFGSGASAALIQSAAMLWFAAVGLVGSLALPGLPILFVPPVLIFCAGVIAALRWQCALRWSALASAIVALLLWAPLLYLTELAVGYDAPVIAGALAVVMLLPWMGVMADVQGEAPWRPIAAIVSGAAIVGLIAAALAPGNSAARPRALNINYVADTENRVARFSAGLADVALPKTLKNAASFKAATLFADDAQTYWIAPAPFEKIAAPHLTLLSNIQTSQGRVIRARLAMNGADSVTLTLPGDSIKASVNGAEAWFGKALSPSPAHLSCQGRACDSAEIALTLPKNAKPMTIGIVGRRFGAAPIADALIRQRPDSAIPYQNGDGVITLGRERLP